jgi:predicted PP-loop superfamily ATPase
MLCNDLNIVEDIKIRRLGWSGHVIRMEEGRIPKKVLNGTFHNTRLVGRCITDIRNARMEEKSRK